jgi:hypothetical protein
LRDTVAQDERRNGRQTKQGAPHCCAILVGLAAFDPP